MIMGSIGQSASWLLQFVLVTAVDFLSSYLRRRLT